VDDAARAPLTQFSEADADARAKLEDVLVQLCAGVDPLAVLEALQDEAEQPESAGALANAYAEALNSERLAELPRVARLEVLLQAAWLCGQQDGQEPATLLAATQALDLAPADERALAIAEPLLLDAEAYSELANRYAMAATVVSSDARAKQLLERAIHMLEGIPAATPAVMGLTERLAQLPALRESDEALLGIVRGGGPAGASALVKLGERWLAEGRVREGVEQLPADLGDFRSEAALDVLERLFDHAEATERLEQVLLRRVEQDASPLARGRALEKLGAFHHDQQRDQVAATGAFLAAAQAYLDANELEDAERAYERLLAIAPDHVNAAARLTTLRAQAGNFAGVADAFGVVLRASDDNRHAAELLLSIVGDAERAAAAEEFAELADNVLWRASGDDRALSDRLLRASARLYAVQTRHDEAAELYRRLIADRATSEDLDAYQALIDSNPGSEWRRNQQRWLFEWQEHHSSDRPTVLLSWARFEERELGDPQAAMKVLDKAAELAPDRPEIWEGLTRLRFADGDGAGGLAAAAELRRLGRDVDASLLGLLLEHEPGARWAVDRVKLTLSAEQRWPELFELYERAIAASADDRERAAWLDEAAIAARDVAQDRQRALGYWQQYFALSPDDPRVDLALERLYEQLEEKPALIRHLERRLERADAEQRATLERRITDLSLELGALGDALTSIERLRAAAPGEGDELLERLFARSVELADTDASLRAPGRRAAQLLRARAAELGRPEDSARLLRAELNLSLEPAERRELLGELSRLCERELDDLSGAFDTGRELFLSTLGERERKRLEKLAKKLGRWSELCQIYAQAAGTDLELDERRALLERAARIAGARLRDGVLAIKLYRQLFELDADHASAVFAQLEEQHGETPEAFEALCQLLDQSGRFEELSVVLAKATETRPSPALFSRLGRLRADQLGDIAGAITSHLQASDARSAGEVFLRQPSVFGEDAAPAIELSRRLFSVGLPEGGLRVLRHQLASYASHYPPERKRVHLELVKALEETGAQDAAQEELSEAAKRYPTDADVQRACAVAAAARKDWDRAEQCYRTLLLLLHGSGAQTTDLRRASVYVELGAIKLGRGEGAAAEELFESAFESALGDAAELTALAQSLIAHEQWPAAERATSTLLQLARDLKASARALWGVAELKRQNRAPSPALLEQAGSLAQAAAKRFEELSEPEERSSLVAACVSLLPLEEARQLLRSAEGQLSELDALGARLELARRLLGEGSAAAPSDADAEATGVAIAELQALVSHPNAPTAAFELLARAWDARSDAPKLAEALDAWLEREPKNPSVLARALRAALARSDAERALELYDRLGRESGAPEAELSTELCKLCLKAGKTERAVQLLRSEAERERQPAKRAALLVEAAELMSNAGDTRAARATAEEARALDASSADAVWLLARLALADGKRDDALALLTDHAEAKERRRGKPLSRVLRLAADLRLERDELGEALPLLIEAHQLDKSDVDTALLLGLLAVDMDRLETAASALRVLIAQRELGTREGAAARSLSLAQGYFQLARIEQHHGKKTNARRMALRALEENPKLVPAQRLLNDLGLH
jgi:tetratricopeptide (TPR) repeat protein